MCAGNSFSLSVFAASSSGISRPAGCFSHHTVSSSAINGLTRKFLNALSQFSQIFSGRRDKSPWVLRRYCPLGVDLQRPWPRTTNLANGVCQCTRNIRCRHHDLIVDSLQLDEMYDEQDARSERACITERLFELGLRRQAFSALGAQTTKTTSTIPHESAVSINSITLGCNRQHRIFILSILQCWDTQSLERQAFACSYHAQWSLNC